MKSILAACLLVSLSIYPISSYAADFPEQATQKGLLRYVDPRIGTSGHGHTFMGAAAPFGAVQPGPNNFNKGWDWCSGYHASDSICSGFAHLHLNGTGCSDTGDLLFMPTTGTDTVTPGTQNDPDSGYASRYPMKRSSLPLHITDFFLKTIESMWNLLRLNGLPSIGIVFRRLLLKSRS